MKIYIGSDHHGVDVRFNLGRLMESLGHEVVDVGPKSDQEKSTDYPDVAAEVALAVSQGRADRGVLICGTGIGMSIVANKFPGVRAAPILDVFCAELSRRHNDLNVLCLSAEMTTESSMTDVVRAWLRTEFPGELRHRRRLKRLEAIEQEQIKANRQ
ncbi:MAG: RpiB/LacA/LacB family sugar-phosphate isomerase [Planctomycetia bacterium]|nr:RpiB/LacA/LacB family sugar-phosphate isomerase [Planctomycetia bacterium]